MMRERGPLREQAKEVGPGLEAARGSAILKRRSRSSSKRWLRDCHGYDQNVNLSVLQILIK